MKYIIFDNKYPVLFPDDVLHYKVKIEGMKPTSAGHFNGKAFDRSESLNLEPKEGDTEIINYLIQSIK